MKRKIRNLVRKILPFVLVGIITSSAVMLSYNECRDVKAVAVVDDVVLVTALLAMCGVAWIGTEYTWSNGDWGTDGSSALDWGNGFDDTWEKQWDKNVKEQGQILGYLDENGYITGGGGSGSDPNDDNNKFPSWQELKQKLAENSGNIASVLTALTPFVALYSYDALKQSGAQLADKLIDDGINVPMQYLNKSTIGYTHDSNRDYLYSRGTLPICAYKSGFQYYLCSVRYQRVTDYPSNFVESYTYVFSDGKLSNSFSGVGAGFVTSSSFTVSGVSYKFYYNYGSSPIDKTVFYCPIFDSKEQANSYLINSLENNDSSYEYINSDNIGESTSLKEALKSSDELPQLPLNSETGYLRLPTSEELSAYMKALKNASSAAEKDTIVDGFVDKITNPDLNPEPEPNPEPKPNPEPEPNPEPNPSEENGYLIADLKRVFPFCVPFDLVDCFKLFNAEPVTPRVEFPIHFGIVEKDYTFVIDLEDFNGVAKVCRLMFLIGFIVSLVYATRQLIRG